MEAFEGLIEAHPALWQFVKYALCGVVGTVVNVGLFHLFAWKLFPALQREDWFARILGIEVDEVDIPTRSRNSMIDNFLGFLVANGVVYAISIVWIFQPGRHPWWLEILLFYAVSGISVVLGTGMMGWLIRRYGMLTTYAFGANLVSALMINYAARRFLIFKG